MIKDMLFGIVNNSAIMTVIKIVFIFGFTVLINKVFRNIYKKSNIAGKIHLNFMGSIISAIIYILGMITIIYQIPGMNKIASTLLAGSGIAAAALGLGAKEAFGNVLSGIVLSLSKPFDIGDRVVVVTSPENITGFVQDITLRHTIIRTYKNTEFIITNSMLDNLIVENTTNKASDFGIIEFIDVSVAYESDLKKAKEIVEKVVGDNELFYDTRSSEDIQSGVKKVTVRSKAFNDSGINIRATLRTRTIDDSYALKDYAIDAILEQFNKNGIEIPYNKLVIYNQKD